jgi:2-polyprenyl-3-methyl-5-hydroxy-6-metoxy-1,4-benzoquinol methylase
MADPAAAKPPGYYGQARPDLLAELPRPLGDVLDVGCGEGAAAELLRARGARSLTGIELVPEAAARARERYDDVREGDARAELTRLRGPFDTILCYDVLEHLVDPGAVLRAARERASPGGHLHVSVPNGRHWSLAYDLVVRGTFGYAEWGHRDSTHLRWFTPRDLRELVAEAGWEVEWTMPSLAHYLRAKKLRVPHRAVWAAGQFFAVQWFCLARAR